MAASREDHVVGLALRKCQRPLKTRGVRPPQRECRHPSIPGPAWQYRRGASRAARRFRSHAGSGRIRARDDDWACRRVGDLPVRQEDVAAGVMVCDGVPRSGVENVVAAPPVSVSAPAPGPPTSMSRPPPPDRLSLPALPSSTSLPGAPRWVRPGGARQRVEPRRSDDRGHGPTPGSARAHSRRWHRRQSVTLRPCRRQDRSRQNRRRPKPPTP